MIMEGSGNFAKVKQLASLYSSLEVLLQVLVKLCCGHHKENTFHCAHLRKTKDFSLVSSGLFI